MENVGEAHLAGWLAENYKAVYHMIRPKTKGASGVFGKSLALADGVAKASAALKIGEKKEIAHGEDGE